MIDLAQLLVDQVAEGVWPATLCFLRIGAAMAVLPGLGEAAIPMRIRLMASLALTAVVLPAVIPDGGVANPFLSGAAEVVAGLALGLSLRLLLLALQTAAAIAAQSLSLSQLFPAAGGEPQPALGTVLSMAALAMAFQAGLHAKLAAFFILSYALLPAGRFPVGTDLPTWGVGAISDAMALGFSLAMPFVLIGILWNVALGAVNRAMPQLMVAFVGAPALALGSLVAAAVFVPLLLSLWLPAFDARLGDPFTVR